MPLIAPAESCTIKPDQLEARAATNQSWGGCPTLVLSSRFPCL
jgi:hypothetical protein